MVSRTTDQAAELLSSAFVFSGSICLRRKRSYIVEHYEDIAAHEWRRKSLLSRFGEKRTPIRLSGLEHLREFLHETKPSPRIFAVCLMGPYPVAAALIALSQVKIATAFWKMGRATRKVLAASGVFLIDLFNHASAFPIIDEVYRRYREGYNIFLLVETPTRSRRRYKFFGYSVTCSSLIEALSRRFGWGVHFLHCSLRSETEVQIQFSDLISSPDITQQLLSRCEAIALKNIGQYIWSPASIVWSDPQAYVNGLTFLPEILTWREQKRHSDTEGTDR